MIPMIDEIKTQGISFMNIPTNVMDNGVCWRTVKSEEGFKLQQNNIAGHARIINNRKIRLAWGDMKAMQLAFNNCEHFALWCKTGIHESIQVEDMFKRIIFRSILMLEKSSKNTLAMTNVVNVN